MKRRNFLLALLAAPFAWLLPKAAPDVRHIARVCNIDPSDIPQGSDQTSIYLMSWGNEKPREFTGPYAKWERRMWMKGRIS